MNRYLIRNNMLSEAMDVLDMEGIPYDMDSGDRIMVEAGRYAEYAVEAWENEGIDYDEI